MSNEEKIATLVPELQTKCVAFIEKANEWLASQPMWTEYRVMIGEARRTLEYQAGLYSEGRYWNVSGKIWIKESNENQVTWTMESKHIEGKAFDIFLMDKSHMASWPTAASSINKDMWIALANIGKDLGLFPGALWEGIHQDWTHYSLEQE